MEKMHIIPLVFFVAAGLLVQAADDFHGSSMLHRNIAQLTALSDHILVGQVINASDGIENQIPYTENYDRDRRSPEGKKERSIHLQTAWPSRTSQDARWNGQPESYSSGMVNLRKGEEVLLFLHRAARITGLRTTVGLLQGKFKLVDGKLTNAIGNAGLFRDVSVPSASLTATEGSLLSARHESVDAEVFLSQL